MARALKIFMRGKRVTMLQELLGRMGYTMQDRPGQFGTSTRDAVKQFQASRGLKSTGIVDDALLQSMQQGQPVTVDAPDAPVPDKANNEQQLDILVQLLIRKGILTDAEWQEASSRPAPRQLSGPPLV